MPATGRTGSRQAGLALGCPQKEACDVVVGQDRAGGARHPGSGRGHHLPGRAHSLTALVLPRPRAPQAGLPSHPRIHRVRWGHHPFDPRRGGQPLPPPCVQVARAASLRDSRFRPTLGAVLHPSRSAAAEPTVLQTLPLSAVTCANIPTTTGLRTYSAQGGAHLCVRASLAAAVGGRRCSTRIRAQTRRSQVALPSTSGWARSPRQGPLDRKSTANLVMIRSRLEGTRTPDPLLAKVVVAVPRP